MAETLVQKVRLAGIVNESVSDGPGLRITLFFQGCEHHCPGCHNPQTWSFQSGDEYLVDDLLHQLPDNPLIRGITLSGGDPFFQPEAAITIAQEFHKRGKDVWAYTGFLWEKLLDNSDIAKKDLLTECDVLIDGPFLISQRNPSISYRGSINQRIIDVPESLKTGKIIEWRSAFE